MQNKKILLGIVGLLLSVGAIGSNPRVVTVDGGTIHLKGSLTNGACAVTIDSLDKIIEMGQVRTADFSGVGSYSSGKRVSFYIKLTHCDKAVSKAVGISFLGATDVESPQVLVAGEGGGASSGVGLAIFDSHGDLIIPNMPPQKLDST